MREYLISGRDKEVCHTERSEVSPEDFSQLAEIFGDSSLPSVVQNDKIIFMLNTHQMIHLE
jgi:hypothetical protein